MYNYAVLTEKLLPISFLTYSSEENLPVGQLVEVPIRNNLEKGVIWKQSRAETPSDSDKFDIKPISNLLPYCFSRASLNFWQSFAYNNFSSLNRVLEAGLESFDLLTKADWKTLEENYSEKNKSKNLGSTTTEIQSKNGELENETSKVQFSPKIQYLSTKLEDELGSIEIILRIMYLIRNVQYENILIIFPEIKLLKKWLHNINLKEFSDIELYTFTSGKDKQSKIAFKSLVLQNSTKKNSKVYFTTRSGLFLPFQNLSAVFVIDESNSMHIQEQGGLYFDTREASFILTSQFHSDLFFQSNFPSVRFSELEQTKTN